MSKKANVGEPNQLDHWLVRQRFLDPTKTNEELGALIGLSGAAVHKRMHKPGVVALQEKLNQNIYMQATAIREKAIKNALKYVNSPDSKEGFEITKMFAQAVADSPAAMPEAQAEMPSFYDPDEEDKSER